MINTGEMRFNGSLFRILLFLLLWGEYMLWEYDLTQYFKVSYKIYIMKMHFISMETYLLDYCKQIAGMLSIGLE